MKKISLIISSVFIIAFLTYSCDKDTHSTGSNLPVLSTNEVTDITSTSAVSGGEITSDGGLSVNSRGLCWSAIEDPTIEDSITVEGSGTGSFTSEITGLDPNTAYYVRAYAINSEGVSYGNTIQFTTNEQDVPKCLINSMEIINTMFGSDEISYQISYNDENKVSTLSVIINNDNSFTYEFNYSADGKLDRANVMENNQLSDYSLFTWSGNTVTRQGYDSNNNPYSYKTVIYLNSNNQITKEEEYQLVNSTWEIIESFSYTWVDGNITDIILTSYNKKLLNILNEKPCIAENFGIFSSYRHFEPGFNKKNKSLNSMEFNFTYDDNNSKLNPDNHNSLFLFANTYALMISYNWNPSNNNVTEFSGYDNEVGFNASFTYSFNDFNYPTEESGEITISDGSYSEDYLLNQIVNYDCE